MSSIKDGVDPSTQAQAQVAQQVGHDTPTTPGIVVSHPSSQNGAQSNDAEDGSNGHASQEDQGEPPILVAGPLLHPANAPPQPNPASSLGKPTENSSTNVPSSEKKPPSLSAPGQPQSSRKKRSFWSRLFSALVPCVGHSNSHSPEDAPRAAPVVPEKSRSVTGKHPLEEVSEKPVARKPSVHSLHNHSTQQPTQAAASDAQQPTASGTSDPALPLTVPAAPSADDTVVVHPPPSPKRLSKDITGGVTSGAVQAPGSTGHEDREHVDGESEHSESSSFTEEEADREILSPQTHPADDEFEDEEDRLILNGGAGIPIGPVRIRFLFL